MKTRYLAFSAAIFLSLSLGLWADTQSEDLGSFIVPDPAVSHGILSNGMQYFVRANSNPRGMAELRLVLKVGSVLEDDDQLGLAHFVEHMLFNGTERFPANELVNVLESFGMEYGPEINAYTTFDSTVYKLEVNTRNEEEFQLAFSVLEEWAFNATLTEEEFEKERAVIIEEWRVGRNANARMLDEIYLILFKGSRYADRKPIGSTEIIQNAPVEALRRFYRDWYRPDLMAIIAVGDFDVDETVRMIRGRFSRHEGPKSPRPRVQYEIPRHDETLVKVIHDDEATRSSVQILVKHDRLFGRSKEDLRSELVEKLLYSMFNQRLAKIAREENAPFLNAYGSRTSFAKHISIRTLFAATQDDGILLGMEALLSEAERIRAFGFLDSELERTRRDFLSQMEKMWKQGDDLEPSVFIKSLMVYFLLGDTYPYALGYAGSERARYVLRLCHDLQDGPDPVTFDLLLNQLEVSRVGYGDRDEFGGVSRSGSRSGSRSRSTSRSGSGSRTGSRSGSGDGSGFGYGDGYGSGSGDGSGFGYGDGYGSGSGDGDIVSADSLRDDLDHLRELELISQVPDGPYHVYRLTVPLMGLWIERNVDRRELLKLAVQEGRAES